MNILIVRLGALGDIDPARVRVKPLPGTATERDLVRINDRGEKLYELERYRFWSSAGLSSMAGW